MRCMWALALLLLAGAPVLAAEPAALTRARGFYNEGNYDAAIEAAGEAMKIASAADTASVVLARARLERYRQRADPSDLQVAREVLLGVHQQSLASRDRVDLLVGLGQLL